jgi:hypothetical protein
MPRGGARPGAGRPKGSKEPKTLEKEEARRFLRERVIASLGDLIDSQIENAKGLKYLIARDKKSGKFRRLGEADAALAGDSENEVVEVWEKDPNVSAFTDLLNRTLDKPTEHVEMDANLKGGLVFKWEK